MHRAAACGAAAHLSEDAKRCGLLERNSLYLSAEPSGLA
jgi:hypothetical protein